MELKRIKVIKAKPHKKGLSEIYESLCIGEYGDLVILYPLDIDEKPFIIPKVISVFTYGNYIFVKNKRYRYVFEII